MSLGPSPSPPPSHQPDEQNLIFFSRFIEASTTWSSVISTMLRSGSDLIITGGSNLGVAIAIETVGEEEGEEEEKEEVEEEEEEEKEEKATEEEVEGNEKTVVGNPGWPRGVRMIVFVPAMKSVQTRMVGG